MTDHTQNLPESTPAITLLNQSGDITISWSPENEEAMLALIEQKMKEGYSFFIVKPRVLGLLGNKTVRAKTIKDVKKAGSVVVDDGVLTGATPKLYDAAVEQVVVDGKAHLVKPSTSEKETVRRATTSSEVVRAQTVAVRPIVGG